MWSAKPFRVPKLNSSWEPIYQVTFPDGSTDVLSQEDNYLWRPGLELGQPSSLAGYGIAENEQMPDIAADAKAIAFGNFKRGYTIVDRIGTRILRDPYTNKPFVGFYTTKRTGGMLVDSQAIKLLKIAAA